MASEPNAHAREDAFQRWQALVWEFADEDAQLASTVVATLLTEDADPELTALWFLPDELRRWLRLQPAGRADSFHHFAETAHVRLQ